MGVSDHIELVSVKEGIHSNEVVMVYLQEGNLLPYIQGMVKHNEIVLMQFFQVWKDRKVTVSGMRF